MSFTGCGIRSHRFLIIASTTVLFFFFFFGGGGVGGCAFFFVFFCTFFFFFTPLFQFKYCILQSHSHFCFIIMLICVLYTEQLQPCSPLPKLHVRQNLAPPQSAGRGGSIGSVSAWHASGMLFCVLYT